MVGVQDGPGNPTDWLGLYASGAADTAYSNWFYLNGSKVPPSTGLTTASVPFVMPSTAGPYEFRLFADNGLASLATSPTVTVQEIAPSHPTVTATLLGQTGEDVAGMFSEAPDGVKDVHIQLTGVSGAITGARITGAAGEWMSPFNGYNWIVAIRPQSDLTIVDLYFDFYQPNTTYNVTVTFSDGATQTLQTVSGPPLGPPPPSGQAITMSTVSLDSGFAYFTSQNFGTTADSAGAPTASVLRVLENGVDLGPAHSGHTTIRSTGKGAFSHWQDSSGNVGLYFSTSDNTNPKTNGRSYTFAVEAAPPPPPPTSSFLLGPQTVAQTPLANGTLFASPTGSGVNCTEGGPCSLATATGKAIAGDVVFLRGGVYNITQSVYFSGVGDSSKPITFESYPNEIATFDGSNIATGGNVWVRTTGSWNVLRRIEIRNMPQDGLFISGTHNVVDGINAHHNRMTGIHIYSDYAAYPYGAKGSYNTIQNSTANDNSDVGQAANGGNADGIAISSGEGNKVLNCIAARNSDDGIDTWRSTNTEIAYSISTGNGLGNGDGNGIKGGSGTQPPYSNDTYVHHSLSYKNRANGIDANGGTNVKFSYNTAWANGAYGFVLSNGSTVDHGITLGNNGHVIGSGTATDNSWQRQGTVTFVSTDPASADFMRPTAGGGFEDIGAIVP
jgi:hypothetical protein